jgi:hypothetical protein
MSWSIIITAANREKRLAEALNESGYPAFVPLKRTWRHMYGRPSTVGHPVIPGYVFAVMPPQDIHAFHMHGAHRFLAINPGLQQTVDEGVLAWQIAERYGEFDDFKPIVKVAGKTKPRTRNRRTRRIKRLLSALAEMSQDPQHLAA